ncbi:PEP-CTERM motif protein [Maioricimonas rarisocia]|uniref:PEP-CTERM motif protein n=1 Tax=Maioricimonas rarisocia TaxID=2528026 RepID=A0A517ZCZ2_9PLAN|nr:PEP-CTERM sorting domain-containing protein [Maioricimonas rarisocia]QDU40329.1 PEP-CTERM motif protein [Maioricimonas rarisocia]
MRATLSAVTYVAAMLAMGGQVSAGIITDPSWFDQPHDVLIDFESQSLGLATDQLASQGVSFANYAFGNSSLSEFAAVGGGNVNLDSFSFGLTNTGTTIYFEEEVTAFGFHILMEDWHNLNIQLFNRGGFLKGATLGSTTGGIVYLGYSDPLQSFDEIRIDIEGPSAAANPPHVIDNLSFRPAHVATVPEPSSLALFGIGAGATGLVSIRRRSREKREGASV